MPVLDLGKVESQRFKQWYHGFFSQLCVSLSLFAFQATSQSFGYLTQLGFIFRYVLVRSSGPTIAY